MNAVRVIGLLGANEPGIPVRGPARRKQKQSKTSAVDPKIAEPPAGAEPAAVPRW